MSELSVTTEVARRYLLGLQGLWPGRRWDGKEGAAQAIHALGSVQMDPVMIVARSHDLVLWSRVEGYNPDFLDQLMYRDRRFFDYGGHLDIYPIEELPYWRLHMKGRLTDRRQTEFEAEHPGLLDQVREEVRAKGPLASRDLEGAVRVSSYRGSKDTRVALYNLWLRGELMTNSRNRFERLYDLRERIAPPELGHDVSEADTMRHFRRTILDKLGLGTLCAWTSSLASPLHRSVDRATAKRLMGEMAEQGEAISVAVEGQKDLYYTSAGGIDQLRQLSEGGVPAEWAPLGTSAEEEVDLLSPLDNLLERSRTKSLFGFEYIWEIYKPASARRWGRYTMPILWGDRLVGRLDPKMDRKSGTLIIQGLWLEDAATSADPAFASALAVGLARFGRFHGARSINTEAVQHEALRLAIHSPPTHV